MALDRRQRKFAEQMIDELRRRGRTEPIELDEEQFRLVLAEQELLMLGNVYAEWERTPRLRRRDVLRHFAEAMDAPQVPDSVDEARASLMPRIRDLEYYATLALQFSSAREGKGPAFSSLPLNDQLAIEIVFDHPHSVQSIGPETLEAWGLSQEEALRTARANLRDRTPATLEAVGPGAFASQWQDTYDASRLLLTELISRLEVDGDPVALIPDRNHLLVTGTSDEAGLERIAEIAEPLLADPYRVTGLPFAFRDGRWERFALPNGHPQAARFRRLELITHSQNYGDQKIALEQRLAAAGEDVFVASLMVGELEPGKAFSLCTWTQGVPSLLPRADVVAFVSPGRTDADAEVVKVGWDDAVAVMGSAMKPQQLRPERWRVDVFPDPAQQAELAARQR